MKRPRILVVDDDELVLESLKSELGSSYDVVCAGRASDALGIFRRENVDCVISDVRMPGMDGVSFLKEIGARDPHVGRILITAFSDAAASEAALGEKGVFKVKKPWRDELEIAVRRSMEIRSMQLQLDESLKRFDRGIEIDRRFRHEAEPKSVMEQALAFIVGLDQTRSAEIIVQAEQGLYRLALATPERVFFDKDPVLPEQAQAANREPRIERRDRIWEYTIYLWETGKENWMLRSYLSKLKQDELSWIDFVCERMVDALERSVLVREVDMHRRVAESNHGRLITMEKMASLGLLTAGVAHEIASPAGYVRSNLGALKSYIEDIEDFMKEADAFFGGQGMDRLRSKWLEVKHESQIGDCIRESREVLAETSEGVERVISVAVNLRSFARTGTRERQRVKISSCLDTSLAMVMYKYKTLVTIDRDYEDVPDVLGHGSELGQVFLNLLVNAAQAMQGEGCITLKVDSAEEWVRVRITDDGQGIEPEVLERIFEPLFTTKEPGEGTGLGLSISKEIVEKHGGQIEVDSVVGRGTTFTIKLPALDDHSN